MVWNYHICTLVVGEVYFKININQLINNLNCTNGTFTLLPPGQNGRHFPDDIFRRIFVDNFFLCFILIKISLNVVPKVSIDNNPVGLENGLAPNRRQAII